MCVGMYVGMCENMLQVHACVSSLVRKGFGYTKLLLIKPVGARYAVGNVSHYSLHYLNSPLVCLFRSSERCVCLRQTRVSGKKSANWRYSIIYGDL